MKPQRILDHTIDTILHFTTRKVQTRPAHGVRGQKGYVPAVEQPAIEQLVTRARRVILVGASVSARADGYPTTTPGNGSPGGGKNGRRLIAITSSDDRGLPSGATDLVPSSSTEAAALAGRAMPDPVARAARRVHDELRAVMVSLERLQAACDRFDRLQAVGDLDDPPMCAVAAMRKLPWDVAWVPFRTTDFANQLTEPFDAPRPVSLFVYKFVYNHRRLPTHDEMSQYLQRSIVKVRA